VLTARGGEAFMRHRVDAGEPVWNPGGQGGAFLVLAGDALSLVLAPGENGLTLRSVKLLNASRAVVTATVAAAGGAPEWLPHESTYLLFQGDREAAAAVRDVYFPLQGMVAERSWEGSEAATPLDRLAVAVGRSVARANAALARTNAEAGVALVSQVTIRVCVAQTDLGQGRVLVTLARPGEDQACNQFVELTMTTVPGAQPAATATATATQPGAPQAAAITAPISTPPAGTTTIGPAPIGATATQPAPLIPNPAAPGAGPSPTPGGGSVIIGPNASIPGANQLQS
jgi:hypothetical protein